MYRNEPHGLDGSTRARKVHKLEGDTRAHNGCWQMVVRLVQESCDNTPCHLGEWSGRCCRGRRAMIDMPWPSVVFALFKLRTI